MRDRIRAILAAALSLAFSATLFATAPAAAVVAPKVVIIVGPTGAQTDSYRNSADGIAVTAAAAGATVVKVYSPNATWANVQAAVNGANVIIYLGHGNGYPNPYSSGAEPTDRDNGWGLNRTTSNGDDDNWSTTMVYCGEKALLGTLSSSDGAAQRQYCTGGIHPAAGFVMIYSKACYTPGAGEGFDVKATETVAFQRVQNYSYPVLKLGASAYFATDIHGGASSIVETILENPTMTMGDVARGAPGYDETAQRHFNHPDLSGDQVWIQRTGTGSGLDYWYAYAGNPNASYANPSAPPPTSSLDVTRYAGSDRYATAAAVSAATFAPGVPVAYVATGGNFPDALAGTPGAGSLGGPVLLVEPTKVPSATAAELARLHPAKIVILGGTGAVSSSVGSALQAYTSGVVQRLAGPDRYATAVAVSKATYGSADTVFLATGANFPDALAGGAVAGIAGAPLLLVPGTSLPDVVRAELLRLDPSSVVVLGSTGVVSSGLVDQIRWLFP